MSYTNTTFPTTLDTPSNPTSTTQVAVIDHAGLESFQNNAITALETKVGANSSAVTTTHDYKLSGVTGADKAASKTGTETLTNKTINGNSNTLTVLAASQLSGVAPVANGGTGLATLTANNVILGNGASAPTFVAPGSSGNALVSNGTTWSSGTPSASAPTSTTGVSAGPSSSTTQTITHGLGRTPITIRVFGNSIQTTATFAIATWGTYAGGSNRCVYQTYSAGNPNGVATSSVFTIYLYKTSIALASGVIQNLTSTTFDVVWTTTGDPSSTTNFLWEAM